MKPVVIILPTFYIIFVSILALGQNSHEQLDKTPTLNSTVLSATAIPAHVAGTGVSAIDNGVLNIGNAKGWVNLSGAIDGMNGNSAITDMDDQEDFGDIEAIYFDNFGFEVPSDAIVDGIEVHIATTIRLVNNSPLFGMALFILAANASEALSIAPDGTYYMEYTSLAGGPSRCDPDIYNGTPFSDKATLASLCAPVALSGHEWMFPPRGYSQSHRRSWGSGMPSVTRGSPNDLWGATKISPATLNSAEFGIVLHGRAAGSGSILEIDDVQMTVYYHSPKSSGM